MGAAEFAPLSMNSIDVLRSTRVCHGGVSTATSHHKASDLWPLASTNLAPPLSDRRAPLTIWCRFGAAFDAARDVSDNFQGHRLPDARSGKVCTAVLVSPCHRRRELRDKIRRALVFVCIRCQRF